MNRSIKSKVLSVFLILALMVGTMATFGLDNAYAASKKKIHLKKTSITLTVKKTYQQKLINKNGKVISASKVKWKSLKTSVAKISKKGKITAVKPGTAKMTAKYKGKTYKFTVKVKAPPHNTAISIEPTSLSLMVGDEETIIVSCDNGEVMTAESSNDNIDFEWGEWFDETNDCYLYVKAVAAGTTVLSVYDDYDHSVKAKLNITIKDQTPLEKFHKFIEENGTTDEDGDKMATYALSDKMITGFINHDDSIDFMFINLDDQGEVSTTVAMTMDLPTDTVASAQVPIGDMLATANIPVSSYTNKNSIKWTYYNSDGQLDTDSMTSTLFDKNVTLYLQVAMTSWNIGVRNLTGMSMRDFGFNF